MATLEELSAALVKADAAGNTADAKVFADAIRQMRSAAPAAETPAPSRGKAGFFDLLSTPFEAGMALAQKPRAEQAAVIAPTIEALGAGVGGALGSAAGPAGTVAGAGAGYAGAKELMRYIAGTATPETAPQAFQRVGENALSGATMEALGRGVVGPILDKAAKAAGWVWDAASGTLSQVRAGKIIRQIAGADLDAIKSAAANAPQNLTAAQATQQVGNNVLAALGEKAAKNDVTNYFTRLAAEQEAARQVALRGVTPDLATAQAMRGTVTKPLYTAATQSTTAIDTSPLVNQVDAILQANPGNAQLVSALGQVKSGLEASTNAQQVSSVLDHLKYLIANKDNKFIGEQLGNVKDAVAQALPGYKTAQQVFAAASPPINQAQVLGEMQSVLAKPGGGERVTPFLNALGRGENALIKRAGGEPRFGGIEEVLSPQQMSVVNDITGQFNRDLQLAQSAAAGRGGLSRILGETKSSAELPPSINLFTRTMNKVLSVLEGSVNRNTLDALEKGMRSGRDLTALLDKLPTAQRNAALQALSNSSKDFGRAATFGTNALASQQNENALAR